MEYGMLENSCLFRGIPAQQIEEILREIPYTVQNYEREEIIFRPLETAERVGVILRGSVQSYKLFPNGNQINITIREVGDIIGAAAALSSQGTYPFGVVALERAEILMFSRGTFLHVVQRDLRLVEHTLFEIATITYMLQQRLELLSYHSIDQKIAYYVLTQSAQSGDAIIHLPGTMTKWASMMNVSRPSLHREVKRLEEQGLIRYMPPVIEIINSARLEQLLRK